MIALDHRSAPIPIYTTRSTSPKQRPSSSHMTRSSTKTTRTTPPSSPPTRSASSSNETSLLYPPDKFREISPDIRLVDASQLSCALTIHAQTRLPESKVVFPWLHGLHPDNSLQQDFFFPNSDPMSCVPLSYRGVTLVHAAQNPGHGRLVGAIMPQDILSEGKAEFRNVDPRQRIGLRNFQIQEAKIAMLSDLIIYDHRCGYGAVSDAALALASRLASAQRHFRDQMPSNFPIYNTFILSDSFEVVQLQYPQLVSRKIDGTQTTNDPDFLELEKEQMRIMSTATEISENVFLGNSADWVEDITYFDDGEQAPEQYDVHIQCVDRSPIPSISKGHIRDSRQSDHVLELFFPSSGCLGQLSDDEARELIDFCAWIHLQAHPCDDEQDGDRLSRSLCELSTDDGIISRDEQMASFYIRKRTPRKILISCKDGYTETTFLALAYTMYVQCIPIDEAWIYLHKDKQRDFYAFPEDVVALQSAARALLQASPVPALRRLHALKQPLAPWFTGTRGVNFSGSLPSRILEHLYLGNLEHANNTELLAGLGIARVLTIGEKPLYMYPSRSDIVEPANHHYVHAIQDDGIDSLVDQIDVCLDFIEEGVKMGQKILVHCRVGVSRSASICIADVVRRCRLRLEDAYLLVRARRLNVIIQPNLKFMYELLRWAQEEKTRAAGTESLLPRTIEWPALAGKIARLNRLYITS